MSELGANKFSDMNHSSKGGSGNRLTVAPNGRYLCRENGEPFFWLADTGWLLQRLTREEIHTYMEDRRAKGFNVIQVMGIHSPERANVYGSYPFIGTDFTKPNVPDPEHDYNYWDHLDYIIDTAQEYGLYIALVAVWGSNVVHRDWLDPEKAAVYGSWLANRYKHKTNIVWLIGGDERGNIKIDVWLSLARAIRKADDSHLMTYHPFGRTQSSTWFHHEEWLDFNMFQSGHRSYDQLQDDDPATWKGEDNWRYVQEDYARWPAKPTVDGEPSYEGIPHGLHDASLPYWQADDCRRFAYWSVFAGAFGHTYGHNAVIQMHKPEYGKGAYGIKQYWYEALDADCAVQMQYLKKLILSRPFFERIPDQTILDGDPGFRYDHVLATRGSDYVLAYTYTGRTIRLRLGVIAGMKLQAWWFNPRNGESQAIGTFDNAGTMDFKPPGEQRPGNDWVLVLDDADKHYPAPGSSI